jgi:hypothetical protein
LDSFVIRLRPRIGIFRALSVLVLLAGLVGGLLLSDRKSQQRATSNTLAVEAAGLPGNPPDGTGRAADQKDAQTKADNAAQAAAAQAKSADDQTRKKAAEEANRGSGRSGPASGGSVGPIPANCQVYTGNKATGCTLTLQLGYGLDQVPCLVKLWDRESHWNTKASNASSGAYGIAQARPGSKMASVGADWRTNPVTQIKWGLGYIKGRYKTPCGAWSHSEATGWY